MAEDATGGNINIDRNNYSAPRQFPSFNNDILIAAGIWILAPSERVWHAIGSDRHIGFDFEDKNQLKRGQ